MHHTEVTDSSPQANSNLLAGGIIPLKVPAETIQTNPESQSELNTFEVCIRR